MKEIDSNTIKCIHCGELILKEARICKYCKKSVEIMRCPFCAEEILRNSSVCKHCGKELKYNIYSNDVIKRLKMKIFKVLVFVLFLFITFASLVYFYPIWKKYNDINVKIEVFERSCKEGLMYDCIKLAEIYADHFNNEYFQRDLEKAYELYFMTCNNGLAKGCYELGEMYLKGRGVEKENRKAFKYFEKACEGENGRACYELGNFYKNADTVEKNVKKARHMFRKACDYNDPNGCTYFGETTKGGSIGSLDDRETIIKFHQRTCYENDYEGCLYLGKKYLERPPGFRAEPEYEKAKEAFEKGCEGGNKESCDFLKEIK